MKIELPLLWKISTNEIYSGKHWRTRQKHKDNYLQAYVCTLKALRINFHDKIDIKICFKMKRLIDSDNCSYMVKLIIDCLREANVIIDDTAKYVGWVSMKAEKGDDVIELELLSPNSSTPS